MSHAAKLGLLSGFVILAASLVAVRHLKEQPEMSGGRPNSAEPESSPSRARAGERREPLVKPIATPKIVVHKAKRQLRLYSGDRALRTYPAGLGFQPVGDKQREGDGRTPEGTFYICNKNRDSKYYLSLGLSYPNTEDAARGLREGLITQEQHDRILRAIERREQPPWDTPLGGEIFIHGNGAKRDWTWGCVALEDEDIRELFEAVPLGTPVVIHP